jgi:hypothetical protein
MRFSRIFSIVGDSKLPLLGLVETGLSSAYSFFFTEEKSENIDLLKEYFSKYYPETDLDFHEIPSINDYSGIITEISSVLESMESENEETAVFVTAGTKLMAMSLMLHSKSQNMISCRRKLEFVVNDDSLDTICVPDKLALDRILESCGWSIKDNRLKFSNRVADGISVSYDSHLGQLDFVASAKGNAERIITLLISISEIFGRSGAKYTIKSPFLPNRAKNLVPKFMNIEEG